jgi:hypothetical protein
MRSRCNGILASRLGLFGTTLLHCPRHSSHVAKYFLQKGLASFYIAILLSHPILSQNRTINSVEERLKIENGRLQMGILDYSLLLSK